MYTAACESSITISTARRAFSATGVTDRAARREVSYLEVAYLLLNGELPTAEQYDVWRTT